MLSCLRKLTSLKNLASNFKGQMATLLILMMVAVLIFILVTVNLGNLSVTATMLSNAADQGSLLLASQLSTKSNLLSEVLVNQCGTRVECCRKCGWLAVVLAIVFAIIAVILTWGMATPYVIAIATAAGAVGGGIGAAIAGTPIAEGIFQGAMIGAAIGAGAATGAEVGATAGESAGTEASIAAAELGASEYEIVAAYATAVQPYIVAGAIAGGALATGSVVYNQSVAMQDMGAAFSAAAKALNGLPEYDLYRESVFLYIMPQVIDDPTTVVDTNDVDGDGDVTEKVPNFFVQWEQRMNDYQALIPTLQSITSNFINGPLASFQSYLEGTFNPEFKRSEVEGTDGEVIELMRALYNAGYRLGNPPKPIFEPGPTLAELQAWDTCTTTCTAPPGADEVDDTILDLQEFIGFAQELRGQDIAQLSSTWQSWVNLIYEENETDPITGAPIVNNADYYDKLYDLIWGKDLDGDGIRGENNVTFLDDGVLVTDDEPKGINTWKTEINNRRLSLPSCNYGWWDGSSCQPCWGGCAGDCFDNPLCQTSIDADLFDEFSDVQTRLTNLINQIDIFRSEARQYYINMSNAYSTLSTTYLGGVNPIVYSWSDSRGSHSVSIEVGPYKLAKIETWKKCRRMIGKICLRLKYYSDEGRCWVKITRQDPANTGVGVIGRWNPYDPDGDGIMAITRTSRASYSYDYLRVSGR